MDKLCTSVDHQCRPCALGNNARLNWASAWDFQQCGMCNQQSFRSACAYAQSVCAVWSEPLLGAWVFYDCWATDWTPFGVSKLKWRLQRLVRVYTCQNVKLFEISFRGSIGKDGIIDVMKNIWTPVKGITTL